MAGTRTKDSQEFTSDQLRAELIEIKERLGSLETIASLANREIVETYVTTVLKGDATKKKIMRACQVAQTRNELKENLSFESSQALDYHLNPLRDNDLLHENRNASNNQVFEWSKLFKHLPKATRERLLS
jgi:hypothetical protein